MWYRRRYYNNSFSYICLCDLLSCLDHDVIFNNFVFRIFINLHSGPVIIIHDQEVQCTQQIEYPLFLYLDTALYFICCVCTDSNNTCCIQVMSINFSQFQCSGSHDNVYYIHMKHSPNPPPPQVHTCIFLLLT